MGGRVVLTLFESRHVARGGGDLGQVDAHVDRGGLDADAAAGAELPVLVAAPGPEPAGAIDRVARVAARVDRSERHARGHLDLDRHVAAGRAAVAELALRAVTPGPDGAVGEDGDGLAVSGAAAALGHLAYRRGQLDPDRHVAVG